MPPHCDSLDGPVVAAARDALRHENVALVLPYVPEAAENEVHEAFSRCLRARREGPAAHRVADRWFYETVVRLHRAGEGAPFTGLKPAGLDVGPVIPVAEEALASDDVGPLVALLTDIVRDQTQQRFERVAKLRANAGNGVASDRAYVSAMLGLQVWAHHLAKAATAEAHG